MLIYPTPRAILVAGAAAIAAFLIAAAAPGLWAIGFAFIAGTVALMALDAALSPWPSALRITTETAPGLQVGRDGAARFGVSFAQGDAPQVESRLETNEIIRVSDGPDPHSFTLTPLRRGVGEIEKLWLRWRGPLGLVFKQHVEPLNRKAAVTANTKAIEEEAISILTRELATGAKVQIERGEGAEFDALREFLPGMDSRAIDWKQTARHRKLLTREFRTEKNNAIVFAIDTGRLMCEPIANGVSRLDHAVNAALMMAFVSLKLGDRVGFFSFDAKPRVATGLVSGSSAFGLLKALSAEIDYTDEEANYTLALSRLSGHLDRRSLVVVFTDFADSTSAELLVANLASLMKRHLVLFVAFRDDELESLIRRDPERPEDVARAVIADRLMRERDLVVLKLQQLGAHVVDAPSKRIGVDLINRYIRIKKRDLL
jgi:uncharacterized protein (DUF58 family)